MPKGSIASSRYHLEQRVLRRTPVWPKPPANRSLLGPGPGFALAAGNNKGSWAEPRAPHASHPARGRERASPAVGGLVHPCPVPKPSSTSRFGCASRSQTEPSACANAFATHRVPSCAACAALRPPDTHFILAPLTAQRQRTALQPRTPAAVGKLSVSLVFPRQAGCADPA